MSLQNTRELEVTREKLAGLEKLYQTTSEAPTENNYTRELTLRSIRHTINQLNSKLSNFPIIPRKAVGNTTLQSVV